MACSATTVLPEPVGAATSTDRPSSRAAMARSWKSSSSKSYVLADVIVPGSSLEDEPADEDGHLVEDAHRDRHGEQRDRVARGRDDGIDHEDADDGPAAGTRE